MNLLCGLIGSNEKERIDMKLENARMKQEIADMRQEMADLKLEKAGMKLEKAGIKLEIITFGLQYFPGSDDDIGFYTGFPCYSILTSFYESHLLHSIDYWDTRLRCNVFEKDHGDGFSSTISQILAT